MLPYKSYILPLSFALSCASLFHGCIIQSISFNFNHTSSQNFVFIFVYFSQSFIFIHIRSAFKNASVGCEVHSLLLAAYRGGSHPTSDIKRTTHPRLIYCQQTLWSLSFFCLYQSSFAGFHYGTRLIGNTQFFVNLLCMVFHICDGHIQFCRNFFF